jgi:hypothetical protein
MRQLKSILLVLCINTAIIMTSYCQNNEYDTIIKSITNKIEKIMYNKYHISGIDIDKSLNNPIEASGKIKDPYHTLSGCFLFLADGHESDSKGFIGLYRVETDSVIWQSVLLSDDFSNRGRVVETNEINKDGKVEIIIALGKEPVMTEQLWIFSWNGANGKLITQLDKYGESMIMEFGEYYELKDMDCDGIYEILGKWYKSSNSKTKTIVTYAWNGSIYGKWGKSSKYLLKEMKK